MTASTPSYQPGGTWFFDERDEPVAKIEGALLFLPEGTPVQLRGEPNHDARVMYCQLRLDRRNGGSAWMDVRVTLGEPGAYEGPRSI